MTTTAPLPTDAPAALRALVNRMGAAIHALEQWELENGSNVMAMRKELLGPYAKLLEAKADARAAVKAAWHEWHDRSVPLPEFYK